MNTLAVVCPNEERQAFEKKLESDQAFADEVAFYLSTMAVSREDADQEKKQLFRKLYEEEEISTRCKGDKVEMDQACNGSCGCIIISLYGMDVFFEVTFSNTIGGQVYKRTFHQSRCGNGGYGK